MLDASQKIMITDNFVPLNFASFLVVALLRIELKISAEHSVAPATEAVANIMAPRGHDKTKHTTQADTRAHATGRAWLTESG